jgi:hypothetical protein
MGTMTETRTHQQIALAFATEVDMECYSCGLNPTRGDIFKLVIDCSKRNARSTAPSPPRPQWLDRNPCYEIPLNFELYIWFRNGFMCLGTEELKFELGDPNFLDKLIAEFSDLNKLTTKITDLIEEKRLLTNDEREQKARDRYLGTYRGAGFSYQNPRK